MAATSEKAKGQGRNSSGSGSLEVIEKPRTTTVSVDDSETWVEAKRFTVYKVVVKVQGRSYFIFRRYNEFSELHDKLKRKFLEANSLKLPGKRFLGNNFDPEFIRSRKERLHEFMLKMAKIPGIMEFQPVRDFLSVDSQRSTFEIYDNETIDETNDPASDSSGSDDYIMDLGGTEKDTAEITDFDLLKVIGKGSFGKVYLSRHKSTGQCYAIKVLQKKAIIRRNEVKHIMAERNVLLKNVTHPFLVGLHYSFQTGKKLYFVLDYVNGGELFFHLQRERVFEEPRARFYAAEITSALAYLHNMNIVYRDLKPENILLDANGHIILTDFGLCKENVKIGETTTTFCGTPEYLAPEVLRKQEYGREVDWWCLGVVTYEMMYSLPPFYSRDVAEMYENILHKPLKLRPHISSDARNLLEGLLQKEKSVRLGSGKEDAEEIKSHPFFGKINWDRLYRKEYEPPFNPNVAGDLDLKHFDPEFTTETVSDTPSPPRANEVSLSVADDTFAGFSYIPPTPQELL